MKGMLTVSLSHGVVQNAVKHATDDDQTNILCINHVEALDLSPWNY